MKLLLVTALSVLSVYAHAQTQDTTSLLPVEVVAVRAAENNPFAKTNISKADIQKNNTARDLPFFLDQVPGTVINSDAGNGVGYTGIRIRGTDASRINVTLNGIPYNDAESQGTYFVDLPDIASSAGSIQVQRGVGTSSNGAGSFGGSINVSTNEIIKTRSVELNNAAGSFGTLKNTLIYHSGLLSKYFTTDIRVSNIRSDGYIDRAKVNLLSGYLSTAFIKNNQSLRLNIFSGKEKTYQAWYGVNEVALDTNRTYNTAGMEKPGDPYKNQTDNYVQTHYQLFYSNKINKNWQGNTAIFLTRGIGYYEQYKADADVTDYKLQPFAGSISSTDLVRRLWLNNFFYGGIFSLQYDHAKNAVIVGGGYNIYEGDHYGTIKSTVAGFTVPKDFRYYSNYADKKDASLFTKWTHAISTDLETFVDLQIRNVNYKINGFQYNPDLIIKFNKTFFNPKAGITYHNNRMKVYASYSRAEKEPNRDDFESSVLQQPKPEILNDAEAGISFNSGKINAGVNFYGMFYKDQLVLTGKINDVGAYTRTNIKDSYRAGAELQAAYLFSQKLKLSANFALSTNKVKNFSEFIDDYDNGGQIINNYTKSDIAFSPSVVAGYTVDIIPVKNFDLTFSGKFVGDQYLDNTSNKQRMLDSYYSQDARAAYTFKTIILKRAELFVQVNNIFSARYEPNGYTFSYRYNNTTATENYYFPMALINFIAGINLKF